MFSSHLDQTYLGLGEEDVQPEPPAAQSLITSPSGILAKLKITPQQVIICIAAALFTWYIIERVTKKKNRRRGKK